MHKDGLALNTVINDGGWQVVKEGAVAENTTVNQKGRLQVNAGGKATDVTQNTGSALVTSTAATVTGTNRLGVFSVVEGKADNVVLENGGRLDVLSYHTATNTHVDEGVPWMSAVVAQPPPYPWGMAVYCLPIPVPLSVVPGATERHSVSGVVRRMP